MKKFLTLLLLLMAGTLLSQTTNYFWTAGYTSNYVSTNLSAHLTASNYTTFNTVTSSVPTKTLFYGLTTNTPVTQLGVTNYWWFTNGILTLITNSAT